MRTVRRNKSKELKEKDFYQTNPAMVRALLKYLPWSNVSILDPCCGEGVICGQLALSFGMQAAVHGKKGIKLIAYDKFPKTGASVDFMDEEEEFDYVIMNPPFSQKYEFIDKALEVGKNVFCLLPLDVMNYNVVQRNYLSQKFFCGVILMTPKLFLHSGTEAKRGGNSSYGWFHFSLENKNKFPYMLFENLEDYGL
jgi:predicted RNA methylase